jgi:5'-nucleotidase
VQGAFILGVDLDGVCADHTAAFREVVAAERGVDPATLPDQTSWSFEEWGLDDEAFLELHKRAVLDHRMFRTMPVLDGCAEALWRLSDAGVWIRIVTHRLYTNWGHAVAVGDTVAWLDQAGIPYRDLCFLGNKPQVEADAYVDDAPHNIAALQEAGDTVLVYDRPYNQDVEGRRVHGWAGVEAAVLELLAAQGTPVQEQFPGFELAGDRLQTRLGKPEPAV